MQYTLDNFSTVSEVVDAFSKNDFVVVDFVVVSANIPGTKLFATVHKVRKLSLDKNETYSGESSANFKETQPFHFFGL